MKIHDDEGCELDANFSVSVTEQNAFIIVESRGGGGRGSPQVNTDYNSCVIILLRRLSALKSILLNAEVYSRVTCNFLEPERQLNLNGYQYPLHLNAVDDLEELRLELARKSSAIGRSSTSKGGNRTKRLRFLVDLKLSSNLLEAEIKNFLQFGGNDNQVGSKVSETIFLKKLDVGCSAFYDVRNRCVFFSKDDALYKQKDNDVDLSVSLDEFDDLVNLTKLNFNDSDVIMPPSGVADPQQFVCIVNRVKRSVEICAWALAQANGICEVCDSPAPFLRENNEPFLEVHHVRPLSDGGPDVYDNVVALCPNCHRRLHHDGHKDNLRLAVIQKVNRLKDYPIRSYES